MADIVSYSTNKNELLNYLGHSSQYCLFYLKLFQVPQCILYSLEIALLLERLDLKQVLLQPPT